MHKAWFVCLDLHRDEEHLMACGDICGCNETACNYSTVFIPCADNSGLHEHFLKSSQVTRGRV